MVLARKPKEQLPNGPHDSPDTRPWRDALAATSCPRERPLQASGCAETFSGNMGIAACAMALPQASEMHRESTQTTQCVPLIHIWPNRSTGCSPTLYPTRSAGGRNRATCSTTARAPGLRNKRYLPWSGEWQERLAMPFLTLKYTPSGKSIFCLCSFPFHPLRWIGKAANINPIPLQG